MKRLLLTLLAGVLSAGTLSAQRLQVGIRGGIDAAKHAFDPVTIGSNTFSPASGRVGFETGFVVRLNLTRHLHLQSELDYNFVNYAVHADGTSRRDISLRAERLEVPVQLGLQFGVVRLFGGMSFRLADSSHSSAPQLLRVRFNNDEMAVMGGIGLNIRHFFLDFRVQGYPRSRIWNTFVSEGVTQRVKVSRDLVYGGSIGFFF